MLRSISDLKIGKSRVLCEMKNWFKWFSSFFHLFSRNEVKKMFGVDSRILRFHCFNSQAEGPPARFETFLGAAKPSPGPQTFFFTFSGPKKLFLIFPDPQNVSQRFPIHTPVHVYSKVVSGLTDWKLSKPYFCRRNWLILGKYFKQVYHSSTV